MVDSAYRIIAGKGATNYAVALAGSRIIEAVLKDERRVLPVSSLLDDYYGISDVCLSVPAVVGRGGVGATARRSRCRTTSWPACGLGGGRAGAWPGGSASESEGAAPDGGAPELAARRHRATAAWRSRRRVGA